MITSLTRRKLDRIAERARDAQPAPVELTRDQYEAARLGHPDLTADEAAYYVHESHRYIYDLELWSRDAMPEDPEEVASFERYMAREANREERAQFGGRSRRAIERNRRAKASADFDRRYRSPWGDEVPF